MQEMKLAEQMSDIVIKRIQADRLVLPSMPEAAEKCLKALRDPDANLKVAARLLERDPLLTARILRQASSAGMGGQTITNLEQAAARLGVQKLKNLLVDASTRKVFESHDKRIADAFKKMWEHSVAVALLARDVAALCSIDADVAYLAGLLHDIGKPVVGTMMLEAEKMLLASRQGGAWVTGEVWLAGVNQVHRPVGNAIAEKWQLPETVRATIAGSSEYDSSQRQSPVNAVCFANALAKAQGYYPGPCDVEDANALVMIGRSLLGIEDEPVKNLLATLRERIHSEGN